MATDLESEQHAKQRLRGVMPGEADAALIAKLPEHHREILTAQGSYQEIADQFGIAIGTVRSRLHRARLALTELRAGAEVRS